MVSAGGTILAANRATRERLGVDALTGRQLADAVSEPHGEVARYLRACSRSRQMVLGALDGFRRRCMPGRGGGLAVSRGRRGRR